MIDKEKYKARRQAIYKRRIAGEKYKDIAKDYGVTPVRIRQLYLREKYDVEHERK